MDKRGQVTIFVIIAIIIVGVILLLFAFGGLPTLLGGGQIIPSDFLTTCIMSDLQKDVTLLSNNAGYENPEASVMYKGENYTYLCYTTEYYKTCTIQQPFIKNNFEKELARMLTPKAQQCAQSLVTAYQKAGYSVSSSANSNVSIVVGPEKISVDFMVNLVVSKQGATQKIDKVSASLNSQLYNLMFIASSIVDFEAVYGDSETTLYMQYYPDLRIDKIRRDDGSKIYTLTDVVTTDRFRFAVRSLAWPAGYGFG